MKFVANHLLILFVLCWTHCSMSEYGAYMDGCGDSDSGSEVCDLLTDGMTLTAKMSLVAPALALLDEFSLSAPPAVLVVAEVLTPAHPLPPPRIRLCEFLASTACPVRGPACLQA